MKDRILDYLDGFINGESKDLATELQHELNLDASTFKACAEATRGGILHHYSQFSISTIDAFFQRVIRAFTRETGVAGDYRLEVDQTLVMEEVIDNLMDELGKNEDLTRWVVDFASENLQNDLSWDVRPALVHFADEIFKEEYRAVENDIILKTGEDGFFKNLLIELKNKKFGFINFVKNKAREAVSHIEGNGFGYEDFKYNHGGAYGYLLQMTRITAVSDLTEKKIGKRSQKEYQDSKNWPGANTSNKTTLTQLAAEKLIPILNEILDFRNRNFAIALSAEMILDNFYTFGLIADISRKLKEYKNENNIMLLADAPYFLNTLIGESDTPFIYEKMGAFYRHFLIDEFQDTSGLQWKNFLPLLTNSLDQGLSSMIVGDVKQAVYRWRGGDLQLLQSKVKDQIGDFRSDTKELDKNYRSAPEIVSFNNAFFKAASKIIEQETENTIATAVYQDVKQVVKKETTGFVHVSFISNQEEEKWKAIALNQIPHHLEKLQQLGASLKDIAILVRKNIEGQEIIAHLLAYKNSDQALKDCKYEVISNESLQLGGAGCVNLLTSALSYLINSEDAIARAQLGYELARLNNATGDLSEVFTSSNQATFEHGLPEGFTKQKSLLKKLPLFELTETLIGIFKLGQQKGELEYLQAFQDIVLNFSSRERNDLGFFLRWWEDNKSKQSIQSPGEVDAAQIITIHKSKGLQFKYVIVPFCSWDLDHSGNQGPTLWVKSDRPPFDQAGHLPIRYSAALNETVFSEYYKHEKTKSYLDNINLLYVALTRAEHGLIITAPSPPKKKGSSGTVSSLLHQGIQHADALKPGWNPATQEWRSGEWLPAHKEKEKPDHAVGLAKYVSSTWKDKLVLKQSAIGYFEPTASSSAGRIKYGIHLHAIFSRIKYKDGLTDVLEQLTQEGIITKSETPLLIELINGLLANPLIASWFSRDWEVRTEVSLLLPGGVEGRIDRLMTRQDKAMVVDFKTGAPKKTDLHQVSSYLETLRKMDFKETLGYLLYVKTGEIIAVPQGKPVKAVRPNDNQLGLGF